MNGLIVQWGVVTGISVSSDGSVSLAFPVAFNNLPSVNATWMTGGSSYSRLSITKLTSTNCSFRGTDSTKTGYTYFAIGY